MRLPLLVAPLALAVSLTLAGCGGGSAAVDAGREAAEDGSSPEEAAEEVYLAFLEDEGIVPTYGDRETALTLGRQICDRYERGDSFAEVTSTLVAEGFPDYEAGQVSGAATAAFCPERATG